MSPPHARLPIVNRGITSMDREGIDPGNRPEDTTEDTRAPLARPRPGRLALQEACRTLLDAALAARIASEVGNEPLARLWTRRTAHAAARLDDLLTARIVPTVDAADAQGVGGVPGSAPLASTGVADGPQGACGPQRPEPRTPSITVGAR